MLTLGPRVLPVLMARVVRTGSRELFVLVALSAAVGTALVSAEFFGVSLALGAFLAGVLMGQSPFSHQVNADLLPFREAFAVLFFVSVGMLVNPVYVAGHWREVLLLSALVVVGKGLITVLIGFLFPYPGRTSIVVAAGLSQIGEFSFILGQSGLALGLITGDQYALILAGAIVSITINPFVFRLIGPVERLLQRWPTLWRRLDRAVDHPEQHEGLRDHVVIVGCGRVGRHIAEALGRLQIPRLVVESDPGRIEKLRELGVPVLYGDAGNSAILEHAGLPHARALVVTVPDDPTALAVVAATRAEAPDLRIVARASTWEGGRRLKSAGATSVVRPELEGGVEIVRRTLVDLNLPPREVQRYADVVRREGLDASEKPTADQARVLDELVGAARDIELAWITIPVGSALDGRDIGASAFRQKTSTSIVAVQRGEEISPNPGPTFVLRGGDRVAIMGRPAELDYAEVWVASNAP
jgi:CPA2 family monovalent cation:H+ antiporter-2